MTCIFYSANPRNNYRSEDTFLTVERQVGNEWVVIANDSSPETIFKWKSTPNVPNLGESRATITWTIPQGTPPGNYRIQHFGDWKSLSTGKVAPFSATSATFKVYAS